MRPTSRSMRTHGMHTGSPARGDSAAIGSAIASSRSPAIGSAIASRRSPAALIVSCCAAEGVDAAFDPQPHEPEGIPSNRSAAVSVGFVVIEQKGTPRDLKPQAHTSPGHEPKPLHLVCKARRTPIFLLVGNAWCFKCVFRYHSWP